MYVIKRKTFIALKGNVIDYHTVSDCLGSNRRMVDYFAKEWTTLVGKNEIIYTRNPEGRTRLLSSRINSLSNILSNNPIEEGTIWT
ncbi:hypothetical protein [Myroides pelagicus]|uniref:Uncharacterized protein n=1 Tax=Myroides pelagicus TaxID=270914 RepID=A0A7K1GJ95_9FLAO|nr:hypothetical protein [Myroides pelagicus]MTH28589.1 hypothetical protein [Myroides pelagicus]